jgi:predicted metalloprotease
MGRLVVRGATLMVLVALLCGWAGNARAQDGEATGGVEGTRYVSPSFGYELTWSDEWTVVEEASEGGYDFLNLTNGTTDVYLEGFLGFDGDPMDCVEGIGDQIAAEADGGEVTVAETEDGTPIMGEEDGTAFAIYDYTVTFEDGTVVDAVALVQCWTLSAGASVVAFTAVLPAEAFDDQIAAIEGLLAGVAMPSAGTGETLTELEPFIRTIAEDLTEFWTRTLAAEGTTYEAPVYVSFDAPVETGCGEVAPEEVGPFYCPADRAVYLDLIDMEKTVLPYGQFVVAIVLAHEVGHHLQEVMALQGCEITACAEGSRSLEMELQADCFSGAWAKDANERGLLEGGDLENVVVATAAFFGDEPNTPANDPQAHGPGALRTWWLLKGYYEGVEACVTATDPEEAGTG